MKNIYRNRYLCALAFPVILFCCGCGDEMTDEAVTPRTTPNTASPQAAERTGAADRRSRPPVTGASIHRVFRAFVDDLKATQTDAQREAALQDLFDDMVTLTRDNTVALRFTVSDVTSRRTGLVRDGRKAPSSGATLPIPGASGYGVAKAISEDGSFTVSPGNRGSVSEPLQWSVRNAPIDRLEMKLATERACADIDPSKPLVVHGTLVLILEQETDRSRKHVKYLDRFGRIASAPAGSPDRTMFPPIDMNVDYSKTSQHERYMNEPLFRIGRAGADAPGAFRLGFVRAGSKTLDLIVTNYIVGQPEDAAASVRPYQDDAKRVRLPTR